jgi:HipA N-terminal domain
MNLSVYVLGKEIGKLEARGDFRSAMTYTNQAHAGDFVSLTMPVRDASYEWDDVLLPYFQMNLPEGYLLRILQEQFGPVIGGNPMALLSVIGRNMIGRVQVAPPGAAIDEPAAAVDVAALLKGDNSEEAFAQLVREHATSGVSGVVPKFLDTSTSFVGGGFGPDKKATVFSHRHIIKGSSASLPFVSLNEHLTMEVVRRLMPAATTRVSDDGQVLVVDRFDVDANGARHWGMEDFCVLLGLRPTAKYDTTWERMARAVRELAPPVQRAPILRDMATMLLLTHAIRNADCHAKNVALRYAGVHDVHLAPAYDMLTTAAYPEYEANPPAISFMGKKTWFPGKHLQTFIAGTMQVPVKEQIEIVERIAVAIDEVAPQVRDAMDRHAGFHEIGKRMLHHWREGVEGLYGKRAYAIGEAPVGHAFEGLSDPAASVVSRSTTGRSELLGKR